MNPYGAPGDGGRNLVEEEEHKMMVEAKDSDNNNDNRDLQGTSTSTTRVPQPVAHSAAYSGTKSAGTTDNPQGFTYQDSNKIEGASSKSPYPRVDFYFWPSIKAINKALEDFCAKHEHYVYFDADDLILGSLGNNYYKAAHKTIIAELMPNYVHLSALGHQVILKAVSEELQKIIYDDDESNDIETKTGSKTSSSTTTSTRGSSGGKGKGSNRQ